MQYVHTLPLPDGHNLHTLWGDEKANRFLVDVKDIYEAITGFCMPNAMDIRSLRTALERKQAGEYIELQSRTSLSQMTKLAGRIILLGRGPSWPERRM